MMRQTIESPLLSVVIPCYNEEKIVEKTAIDLVNYLQNKNWSHDQKASWEIIFVNDGSLDGTLEVLKKIHSSNPLHIKFITYTRCGGQGKALQMGFKAAKGTWIITLDADLDYSPDHIEQFLEHAIITQADIVVGSPYSAGGAIRNCPKSRLWMSKAINWYFARMLKVGLSTYTSIARLYRKEALNLLLLSSFDKDILPEILIKANLMKMHLEEVPAIAVWNKEKVNARGKGINFLSTISKLTKHLAIGLVERPFIGMLYVFLIPFIIFLVTFDGIFYLFFKNFHYLDSGYLESIKHSLAMSFNESPHTFIFFSGSLQAILIMFFSAIIVTQNKLKNDADFITHAQLFNLLMRSKKEEQVSNFLTDKI
jgi:dolichol-phosphate mannosyltransferase